MKAKEISYSTLTKSPENSTFLDTYAWILFRLGNYEMAKFYAKKALISNGEKDPDLLFHYAEILAALKEIDLAKKYYKLAVDHGYDFNIIEKKIRTVSQNY